MTEELRYGPARPHPKIAFVVYNSVHYDTRVIREAQAAQAAGAVVRVFAFGGPSVSPYPVGLDIADGVEIDRVPIVTIRRWLIVAGQVARRIIGRGKTAAVVAVQLSSTAPTAVQGPSAGAPVPHRSVKTWVIKQWQRADLTVRQFSFWRAATRAVAAWEPDLVHAHDANTLVVAGRVSHKRHVPFVYDSHELWTHRNVSADRPVAKRLERPNERWWTRRASGVITVSPGIAEWLQTHYKLRERPVLVRNIPPSSGEIPDPSEGRLRTLAGLAPEARVMAYCGGLTTHRGIERGIEALPLLADDVHFVLMGPGSEVYIAELRAQAEALGVLHRVHVVGSVDREEVSAALADADVSLIVHRPVVLSYMFGLPNKLFESVHAGVPVVVSDTPDVAAVVREFGVGVEVPYDCGPDELARTIGEVIADSAAYRAACIGAAAVLNWQHEASQLIALHNRVLQESADV